jgi:RES domain-containing protein
MRAFRIVPEKFARDLSGAGAKLAGGRWNPKGHALLYTSTTAALAALEVLVHINWDLLENFFLVEIDVADSLILDLRTFFGIAPSTKLPLPDNWNVSPPSPALSVLGEKWITSLASLGLLVPSAHFPDGPDQNLLLNPAHPQFASEVKISTVSEFRYDSRLKKYGSITQTKVPGA